MQSFKICLGCNEPKPISELVKNKAAKDGFRNLCLACNRARNLVSRRKRIIRQGRDITIVEARSKHRWKNEEIRKALGRAAGRKIIQMHLSAKRRAKERGIEFDITPSDLLDLYTPECPIFKTKLNWEHRGSGAAHDSPSLDRKVPSLGYIKGNVWIISYRANTIKNDATPEELLALANAMLAC